MFSRPIKIGRIGIGIRRGAAFVGCEVTTRESAVSEDVSTDFIGTK